MLYIHHHESFIISRENLPHQESSEMRTTLASDMSSLGGSGGAWGNMNSFRF